jgi:catechol 2,3-dioxygenase-like lactoylglutathione lyase family enzyme
MGGTPAAPPRLPAAAAPRPVETIAFVLIVDPLPHTRDAEMLHHIELYVSDIERSIRFWTPFMERLGYEAEWWSGGINYFAGEQEPYLCLLPATQQHLAAGYHRKRVGLNHLAFRASSRQQVDEIRDWVRTSGYMLLYDERYPYATAPDYYAVYCEDPDRMKVEVVAPGET